MATDGLHFLFCVKKRLEGSISSALKADLGITEVGKGDWDQPLQPVAHHPTAFVCWGLFSIASSFFSVLRLSPTDVPQYYWTNVWTFLSLCFVCYRCAELSYYQQWVQWSPKGDEHFLITQRSQTSALRCFRHLVLIFLGPPAELTKLVWAERNKAVQRALACFKCG